MPKTVHIIDELPVDRSRIVSALAGQPLTVEVHDSAAKLLDQSAAVCSGCVLASPDLAGIGLRGLIDEIKRRKLPLAVVVIGRDSKLTSAVELVRAGAFDFLEHPFSDGRLRSVVRRAIDAIG
jgi:FixJ family two-component response regulator